VRLAFAVAAHLDPEILVVDEVLAVGDAEFQKKCIGKMENVAKGGRTVLFVSHNMATISALCSRAMLFKEGKLAVNTNVDDAISMYLNTLSKIAETSLVKREDRSGDGTMRLCEVWIESQDGTRVICVRSGEDVTICLRYQSQAQKKLTNIRVAFSLRGTLNVKLTDLSNSHSGYEFPEVPASGVVRCTLPRLSLNSGSYIFNAYCSVNGIVADYIIDAGRLQVEGGDFFGTGKLPGSAWGPILLLQRWHVD
jgi:lipopolysaccharide transport system ATP-binding protein